VWSKAREIFDAMKNSTASGKDEMMVFGHFFVVSFRSNKAKRARQKAAAALLPLSNLF
jgi:hypothetical protein